MREGGREAGRKGGREGGREGGRQRERASERERETVRQYAMRTLSVPPSAEACSRHGTRRLRRGEGASGTRGGDAAAQAVSSQVLSTHQVSVGQADR